MRSERARLAASLAPAGPSPRPNDVVGAYESIMHKTCCGIRSQLCTHNHNQVLKLAHIYMSHSTLSGRANSSLGLL